MTLCGGGGGVGGALAFKTIMSSISGQHYSMLIRETIITITPNYNSIFLWSSIFCDDNYFSI